MSEHDPILAAIQATEYADAIMRRTAAGPDESHTDWQPRFRDSTTEKWHPPYGETHVKYHVYQVGGGNNPVFWRANHHGTYQGRQMVSDPTGNRPDIETSKYSTGDEPERVMNWSRRGNSHPLNFRSIDDAKAAAEEHYKENYGAPPKHDYDIDSIMDEHGAPPAGGKRGLGDDEDYSRIFDAVKRALKEAGVVLRRTASVWDWKPYIPSLVKNMKDQGLWEDSWGGEPAELEANSDAGDHYYIRPAGSQVNTLPQDHPFQRGGDPEHWEVEHHSPEIAHDPEGSFGDIYGPTALNKHAEPVEGVHPHGFSSVDEAMDWVKSRHPGESFDPDDKQDPFDPRLIGAGLHARLAAKAGAVSESVTRRIAAELSPPCPDCGQVAGFDEHMVSPRIKVCRNCEYPMTDDGHDDLLENILRGHDQEVGDLPETDHPNLGKHGNAH